MLNNIPHIKAYRMNIGDHLAELGLQCSADDIDGTVQKESIMHLAGSTAPLDHDRSKLARLINDAVARPSSATPSTRRLNRTRLRRSSHAARCPWRPSKVMTWPQRGPKH